MARRDPERKRRMDRERMRRRRAAQRAAQERDTQAWYRRQLTDDHDWQPSDELLYGITLEGHRAWCREVLAMPSFDELYGSSVAPLEVVLGELPGKAGRS
jgi:hypothetical protein